MKVTDVTFNYEGDGVTALYVDGTYHAHGDYYHDKIADWIEGFVSGLIHAGLLVERESHAIPGDKCRAIYELGNDPPKKWPDKRYFKHRAVE